MTRQVLYQNMLSDILDRFTNLQNGTEDYLDIYDVIVDGDIPLSINSLLAEPSLSACVSPWLNTMRDSYNGGTAGLEVTDAGYVIALFQTHSDQKYNRPFIFASTELTAFSARNLFIDAGDSYDPTLWIGIERCSLDSARRTMLFDKLTAGEDDTYCVVYHPTLLNIPGGAAVNLSELYAYALVRNLNEGHPHAQPSELAFSFTPPLTPVFGYDSSVTYQQYYDIYDVLDEWLRADDLLDAFLKMYQITEYVVFRHEFKAIIDHSELKQSFLQQIKRLSQKEGEKSVYLRVFPTLFSGFYATCQPHLNNAGATVGAEDFIKDYLTKDKVQSYLRYTGQTPVEFDKHIPEFIYDMRCCIVHNKEAEFHITRNNVSVYRPVLPLMKEIMKLMCEKIVMMVNDSGAAINYGRESFRLY